MKLTGVIALIGFSVLGCTNTPRDAPAKLPHDQHQTHPAPVASGDLSSRAVAIPTPKPDGPKREVNVLVDHPALKLAMITLRAGTELPEHSAPVPVTIQLLEGSGIARFANREERMDSATVLLLDTHVVHSIVPDEGTTMRLLVHYIRNGKVGPGARDAEKGVTDHHSESVDHSGH